MSDKSLLQIYQEVTPEVSNIYVVPLIRADHPDTDYLYLLYKEILSSKENITVRSISAISHIKLIVAPIFDRSTILHYHWLEFQDWKSAIGIIYKLVCLASFKALGGHLIWTVHNLYPHNKKWISLHKKLYRWMASKADRVLVHNPSAVTLVSKEYDVQESIIRTLPHPVFPSQFIEKEQAIATINDSFGISLDAELPLIGCLGAISSYKRLPELISLVSHVPNKKQMLIAGYVKKGMHDIHAQLLKHSESEEWLNYHNGFISESTLPYLMNAIDICVFNFDKILTSGGIEMALAYNKKIVAPRLESLVDYESNSNVYFFETNGEFVELMKELITP